MVHRSKFETLKSILTSEYWLLFSLSAVFFCFFARGRGANFFLNLTGIFLVTELLLGNYRIKQIPRWYLVVVAICAFLVLASVLNPYAYSKVRYIKRLVRMVIIVFAIHCLTQKDVEDRITFLFSGLLVVSVCWQFAAHNLFHMPFGTFNNKHRLALFVGLALPLILYFFYVITGWYRLIFVPAGILDAILLLKMVSHTVFLAMVCSALFVFIFFCKGWHRWLGIMLIFSVLAALYITDYPIAITPPNNPVTLKNLIHTLAKEERIQLWTDSWKMLMDNSLIAWIVGNGIGSFGVAFPKYVSKYSHEIHPHNYFPEVLHDNGIIGFILIFGGLGYSFFLIIRTTQKTRNRRYSIFLKCIIIIFLIWFIHCFLNFPFYSNYTLFPLGFILGTMLVLVERMPRHEVLQHDNRG